MASVRRTRVLVSGEVQAVGFRYECRRTAQALGLSGWVRNLPDGRVEAVFEGAPDAVGEAVDWARHGPRAARVTGVETRDELPEGGSGFTVRSASAG